MSPFFFPVFPFQRYNYFRTDYGIAEEGPEKSSGLLWLHDTGQTLSMTTTTTKSQKDLHTKIAVTRKVKSEEILKENLDMRMRSLDNRNVAARI